MRDSDEMNILGVSTYYYDSSACLLRDGVIDAALQEGHFSRLKQVTGNHLTRHKTIRNAASGSFE